MEDGSAIHLRRVAQKAQAHSRIRIEQQKEVGRTALNNKYVYDCCHKKYIGGDDDVASSGRFPLVAVISSGVEIQLRNGNVSWYGIVLIVPTRLSIDHLHFNSCLRDYLYVQFVLPHNFQIRYIIPPPNTLTRHKRNKNTSTDH